MRTWVLILRMNPGNWQLWEYIHDPFVSDMVYFNSKFPTGYIFLRGNLPGSIRRWIWLALGATKLRVEAGGVCWDQNWRTAVGFLYIHWLLLKMTFFCLLSYFQQALTLFKNWVLSLCKKDHRVTYNRTGSNQFVNKEICISFLITLRYPAFNLS